MFKFYVYIISKTFNSDMTDIISHLVSFLNVLVAFLQLRNYEIQRL